jgi:hypothetical protein
MIKATAEIEARIKATRKPVITISYREFLELIKSAERVKNFTTNIKQ